MIEVNVQEAKTHLSRYLARIESGEVVIICRRNVPVAEIRQVPKKPSRKRPIGVAKGRFEVPDSFFDDLPEDVLAGFEGQSA